MSRFNPEKLVAIGEGLAAGFGAFTVHRDSQRHSFPALIAKQLAVAFAQPLLEPPGIGPAPGFEPQPVILPGISQATVFDTLPPVEFANLSVPGMTLEKALSLRPRQPLVVRDDAAQTACNLILGARRIATNAPLLTQVESAAGQRPTGVLIELGYAEALAAAIAGTDRHLPSAVDFGENYRRLAAALAPATLLMLTVPDPFDTPFFSNRTGAAETLRVEVEALHELYGVGEAEFLKLPALHEIGFQIFGKSISPLASDTKVTKAKAQAISTRVAAWNTQIHKVAESSGALVYDLHGLVKRLKTNGATVGTQRLTASYLGGLYGLNGYYFGYTAQALLANEILSLLGEIPIDLDPILKIDPAAKSRPAAGQHWTVDQLRNFKRPEEPVPAPEPVAPTGHHPKTNGLPPLNPPNYFAPLPVPLTLPPGGVQELPLNPLGSYFGDGISARHCPDPQEAQFGSGGDTLFGGLAMVDSHLRGSLRFEFTQLDPGRASFQLSFQLLSGDDAVLAAPVLFRMPFQSCRVAGVPTEISSGEVDLRTGSVSRLRIFAQFDAAALRVLVGSNPRFPRVPLSFVSLDIAAPLEYGSAWARFEQRPDGKLDFSFYGTRFLPLGSDTWWPLNFSGPDGQFAVIPADGTVMHPHLRLSTRETPHPPGAASPAIPANTIRELTLHTHNSAFGDGFTLQIPELGGPATGRAHVLGRLQVQFGMPSGGTVPIAVRNLAPGGLFTEPFPSPVSESFPVHLGLGPIGFNQMLRFPLRTYSMDDIAIIDDPFDIALGAVDLRSGCLFDEHLHRGFVEQDVLNALLRVEPRVRKSSFYFRGPAIVASTGKSLMYRFRGDEMIPYPPGFAFPQPDLTSAFYAGLGSMLDPYLWLRAIEDVPAGDFVLEGSRANVLATIGEMLSCEYRIPADPARQPFHFRYENHTQEGVFTMHSLAWVGFGNTSARPARGAHFDTVTFTGFGVWEKNNTRTLQQVAVQICENPDAPYLGIQISSGDVSNVDTKPREVNTALP